jgi:hypothetical protein
MPQQNDPDVHPVIVVSVDSDGGRKRNRKKKRGSSKSSRRLEKIERDLSRSLHTVTRGTNRGVRTYLDERDDSDRRRRDGAIVDFCVNTARGISEGVSESSPAIVDLAQAFNRGKRRRKQIRRLVRSFPVP